MRSTVGVGVDGEHGRGAAVEAGEPGTDRGELGAHVGPVAWSTGMVCEPDLAAAVAQLRS
jgi:hypothetical protein